MPDAATDDVVTLDDLPPPPPDRTGWPWTETSDPVPETAPDGSDWPKISIVTPSYNQGAFIEETIRSVLLQNYPNLEYIVVDGGSDDQTVEILEKYDPWIDHWVSEPDDGQSDAINKGFEAASGEIFAWLNSDDYYAPHALKQMAEAFQERGEEVEVIVGTGHKINEAGEVVYTPEATDLRFDAFLDWKANNFLQPACFFRRRAWELAGPLREDLFYCLDVDLWLRMAREVSFDRITPTIAYAYEHPEAKTRAHVRRMRAETALVVAEHGGLEVARENLFDMADRLHELEAQAARITQSPLYKLLGPLYRSVRRFLLRD